MAHWEADLFYCLCDLFMAAVKRWSVVVVLKTSKAALNFFSHCNQAVIKYGDCTGNGYRCSGLHSACTLIALEVASTGLYLNLNLDSSDATHYTCDLFIQM